MKADPSAMKKMMGVMVRWRDGLNGHPLAYEHAEGRQHHGKDTDGRDVMAAGHLLYRPRIVFDISDLMCCSMAPTQ